MIVDGRAIAAEILAEVRALGVSATVRAITVAPTAATRSYLRIKTKAAEAAGMTLQVVELPDSVSIDEVVEAVQAPGADAVIVQLPLPIDLDPEYITSRIPLTKDADALSPLMREEKMVLPPVAEAVREILARADYTVSGKNAVVIGEGVLVGAPVASWLESAGATVLALNEETFALPLMQQALRAADVVVSGAGVPSLIKPDMVKAGAVLIDAGTSEHGGAIVGDMDPACAEQALVFTPVPGGVGPVAVACLFRNVAKLVRQGFDEANSGA